MVFLFRIINSRRCIVDLNASYRFNEDKLETVSNLHFLLKDTVLKNSDNIKDLKDNIENTENIESNIKSSNSNSNSITNKDNYIVGTLSDMNIFHYDSNDNAIKFEQTPDIYYSLLLDSEYVFQKV